MKPSLSTRIMVSHYAVTRSLAAVVSAVLLITAQVPSFAAFTDLADSPLSTSAAVVVKPNILFVLDDSGSMGADYMPDNIFGNGNKVGYKNHLCNSMYYNPSTVYVPPKNPDGSNFPNASFTAAKSDGFVSNSSVRNLSTNFVAGSDGAQPAYYYAHTGPANACNEASSRNFPHSAGGYTKVQVSATSGPGATDERVNFANWYNYYRTRMLMMRSATGRAFVTLTDAYRVGFVTINPGNPVSAAAYLAINDFTATQKANWYSKLYNQPFRGSTPLREALARAGRHFAGKQDGINNGMTGDPIQYSCQRNYTLLTTDGYWNGSAGVKLDGSAMGNHDGVLNATTSDVNTTPRPMYDANKSSGSLADVAQYYYITDLRPNGSIGALGTDVGTGTVPPGTVLADYVAAEADLATWQHMTTFTMGLGLSGTLAYNRNYKKIGSTGDFAALRAGTKNWPVAVADSPSALDDLWHTAVNGRGQFFSAADPNAVVDGLQSVLASVTAAPSAGSSAESSSQEAVPGDNFAYAAKFTSKEWSGDVVATTIDATTGLSAPIWSAQTLLNARTKAFCDNRTIKLFRSGATDNLTNFSLNTFACDAAGNPTGAASTSLNAAEQAFFDATEVVLLSQRPLMTDGTAATVDQVALAAGANMVNFVRGQRGYEKFTANTNLYYRKRVHVLGDIANANPLFVKAPSFNYSATTDPGYTAFKSAKAGRTTLVYVGANDGMLHAFRAGTPLTPGGPPDPSGGDELWAFIPSMVLPNLYKLADNAYETSHQYYVDGTPASGDVFDPTPITGGWRTILVGGLNRGGKGYYALDITDPANPKGLWEFKHNPSICAGPGQTSDCHLGFTYGTPTISKLADGRWAVFVTSGFNNVNAPAQAGDGVGYLYVLNPFTGAIIYKISTGFGDSVTPSGLNQINNFVFTSNADNTTQRVYGVDLQGNIWRFSVNGPQSATLLGVAKDSLGARQPITIRPRLANVGNPGVPYVFVATGRLLGTTDLGNTQRQTVYAIAETLSATPIANLRAAMQLTLTNVGAEDRNAACTSACGSTAGWYADLPDSGERVVTDLRLELGTLTVSSNVPTSTPCSPGGYSWTNYFNASTGLAAASDGKLSYKSALLAVVGSRIVRHTDGSVSIILTLSDGSNIVKKVPVPSGAPAGKRVSWRELVQ